MKKLIKVLLIGSLLTLLIIAALSNPTEKDYVAFSDKRYGELPASTSNFSVDIETINFVIFSTYTPIVAHEHGITHLGIMGTFIQISEGQFDYPWWLGLFN
ncbi:hypothetical protein [Paenisporosarcina sp. TG20]|uniref:hypothetical protein n=1 Tax=Paenisporosarcina sp. TG20 TaxID=1211706 RepID=UPI0002E6FA67|nr:hypothetical protein [Paenisporosarcina sp. TG20]